MAPEAIPPFYSYRILDSPTGAVVIPNLPHLHQSTWTVNAMLQGMAGSSTMGSFTIPLPEPYSELGRKYNSIYLQLQVGQKVEGYAGDTITGTPVVSGVITKIDMPLAGPWTISGSDTLWWLQQSQLYPSEAIGTNQVLQIKGSDIVGALLGTSEVLWDEDFSQWNTGTRPNSSDHSTSGTWNATTDPVFGLPSIHCTGNTEGDLSTNRTWNATSVYTINQVNGPAGCLITAQGVVNTSGTNTSNSGEAGIYANQSGTNRILGRILFRFTGTDSASKNLYAIDAEILSESSGGVFTSRSLASSVLTNIYGLFAFSLQMVIDNGTGVHLILNGSDTGVIWVPDVTALPSSGSIGIRCASLVNYDIYYTRLTLDARTSQNFPAAGFWSQAGWGTNRFKKGSFTASPQIIPQIIKSSSQTYLDMMLMASTIDNYQIRKTPGAGYKGDTIDYGPNLGTDRSAQIVLEEGVNIVASGTSLGPVADLFSHAVAVSGVPGSDSGGTLTWSPVFNFWTAPDTQMKLIDSVSDMGIQTFSLLYKYAAVVGARKSNPLQALQVQFVRTADIADKFREWDTITVNLPTYGVNYQKAQVIGYSLTEGDTNQVVFLNQFPSNQMVAQMLQRITRPVEFLVKTYAKR